jgi:ribosome biogenesis protein BMS1
LIWRNTHPYVLVDRHEDITDPNRVDEDENCERSIVLYGYVRGTHLKPTMKVHLIGVGDFEMGSIRLLDDPLPAGKRDEEHKVRGPILFCFDRRTQTDGQLTSCISLREQTLKKKDALLFAPLSNVGAVSFDEDAVYIDIAKVNYTKKENLALTRRR